jgi:hypothetical protein
VFPRWLRLMNGTRLAEKFTFTKNEKFIFRYNLLVCFDELCF